VAIDRHPVEGRGTPDHGLVIGKYAGCIDFRSRINATVTDSKPAAAGIDCCGSLN
jgi:hypothetical protein